MSTILRSLCGVLLLVLRMGVGMGLELLVLALVGIGRVLVCVVLRGKRRRFPPVERVTRQPEQGSDLPIW